MTELVKKHDGAAEVEYAEHLSLKFQISRLCVCVCRVGGWVPGWMYACACVGICVQWMHLRSSYTPGTSILSLSNFDFCFVNFARLV